MAGGRCLTLEYRIRQKRHCSECDQPAADRPAIEGPPRIDLERADGPARRCQMVPWAIHPARGVERRRRRVDTTTHSRSATESLYHTTKATTARAIPLSHRSNRRMPLG